MSDNTFADKAVKPNDAMLSEVLGKSVAYWNAIKSHIRSNHGEFLEEWKFYGEKSGWVLKMLRKKRNLFFLFPSNGFFTVAFVLGDRALSAAEKSDLPKAIVEALKKARKYAEGRGIRIEVKSPADVEYVRKLIDIKVEN